MLKRQETRTREAAERPAGYGSVEAGSATYRQVGESVTAVLTAAQRAAAQIRATALRDAEAHTAEANSYGGYIRAAADAYADDTRRCADEDAAASVAEAKEQARLIGVEAEQKANKLVAEAIRSRATLTQRTEGLEDWVDSVLTTLRGATSEIEELLSAKRRTCADEPESPADEGLDEALERLLTAR